MNKWFSEILSSFDLGHFIFNIYSNIFIGLFFFPPIFWLLLGLEFYIFYNQTMLLLLIIFIVLIMLLPLNKIYIGFYLIISKIISAKKDIVYFTVEKLH